VSEATPRQIPRDLLPPGTVALVGAGPGDPGLLTVRGWELLAACDTVIYDALANPVLLRDCRDDCRRIYAGKRAEHHSMTQAEIEALLIEEAQAGRRVVRLKGGDPFVFGRGGEECEALRAAGVPYVVVPGITAAVAAAAYAGIPVTHRDRNTSFTLLTGHEKARDRQTPEAAARAEAGSDATDWAAMAKQPLLCIYMGIRSLPGIVENLTSHGMSPDTPAASVQWGTTPRQKTVTATLGTLVDAINREGLGSPAITYVGNVVGLRDGLRWFDNPTDRPLFGKKVVVTRSRSQASELTAKLERLGADVVEASTIELGPPPDADTVRQAMHKLRLGSYDWLVFTSANGVAAAREMLDDEELDARILAGVRVACVGPATASACRQLLGVRPDLVPQQFDADALADELLTHHRPTSDRGVLLLRADIGRASLVGKLRAANVRVDDVSVYETKPVTSLPDDVVARIAEADVITFTSGSTARNLAAIATIPPTAKLVSIGPQTSAALREAGLRIDAEAAEATLDALVAAVVA
jgi:uroporphyrinogen III methyltransferase/synthase